MDLGLRHGDATSMANAAWTQGQQRPSARSTRNGVGGHRHSRVAPIHKSNANLHRTKMAGDNVEDSQ